MISFENPINNWDANLNMVPWLVRSLLLIVFLDQDSILSTFVISITRNINHFHDKLVIDSRPLEINEIK
jgi:hypothetical protein